MRSPAGERDPAKLAKLRDPRVRCSEGTIAKALTGNYRSESFVYFAAGARDVPSRAALRVLVPGFVIAAHSSRPNYRVSCRLLFGVLFARSPSHVIGRVATELSHSLFDWPRPPAI